MINTIKLSLIIIMLLPCKVEADKEETQKLQTELAKYLDVIKNNKNFSGEILVARGHEIVFQKATGLASVEHNLGLKKGAKYRIASITKTFTATLIIMAQQEGKLTIEDKVVNYIPQLAKKFDNITIEHLLTHTSGLPHNEGIKDYWPIKSKLHMTTAQSIEEINQMVLLFEPGTDGAYSSPGYFLLATVLEQVSDDPYAQIVKDRIFNELHMSNTGQVTTLKIIENMAYGYHWVNEDELRVAPYRNYSMLKGAGDMYSTAADLLKWANSFYAHTLLPESTIKSIFSASRQKYEKGGDTYAYGWYVDQSGINKYYHGGGTWGYSSYLALYPDEKLTIIILSNVSRLAVTNLAQNIEKIILKQPFQMPVIQKELENNPDNLKQYVGQYKSVTSTMELLIFTEGDALFAKLGGNPAFKLFNKGQHQFFGKKVHIDFSFEIKDNNVIGVKAVRMGQNFHFTKNLIREDK